MHQTIRALLALLFVSLAACGSARLLTGGDQVNVAIGDRDSIIARFTDIKSKLNQGEKIERSKALLALGITDEKTATVENLRRQDIQAYLFGGSSTLMGDMALVKMLDHMTGVRVPFTDKQKRTTFSGGIYVNTYESGYDLAVVLIFEDGLIRNADQVGVVAINRTTKDIIWHPESVIDGRRLRR